MATYEWSCEQCTFILSKTMSIKKYDPQEKVYCASCGTEMKRKIENVGISFGKGFFRDGYESAKNVKTPTDGE